MARAFQLVLGVAVAAFLLIELAAPMAARLETVSGALSAQTEESN